MDVLRECEGVARLLMRQPPLVVGYTSQNQVAPMGPISAGNVADLFEAIQWIYCHLDYCHLLDCLVLHTYVSNFSKLCFYLTLLHSMPLMKLDSFGFSLSVAVACLLLNNVIMHCMR